MSWIVEFHPLFAEEYQRLNEAVQDRLLEEVVMLEEFGSMLGRPIVDTLKGSKHSNMKELRFNADKGVWRTAFAFDPERKAILLIAGDKSGGSQKRFYKQLIKKADERKARSPTKIEGGQGMSKGKILQDIWDNLPEERRKDIEARATDRIEAYRSLQALRSAAGLTQAKVSEALSMSQGNVSRLEKNSDMLLSTLQKYVEAIGGKLNLTVELPNKPPIALTGFGDLIEHSPDLSNLDSQ